MHPVSQELDDALSGLDARSAVALEQLVRDALTLVQLKSGNGNGAVSPAAAPVVDEKGWPLGYFEKTAGSLAGEPFDIPEDPPPEPTPAW